jgi:amino acid adenylation domain-containing protein
LLDLSELTEADRTEKMADSKRQAVSQPFNLEQGPLLRVVLLKLHPQEHLVILTAHHIVFDGWSWGIVIPELSQLYSALRQGIKPELEEAERFSDYALALEAEAENEEATATEAYWLEQFVGSVPVMDFPTDRPRPPLRTFDADRIDWQLDSALVTGLKQLGKTHGCSFLTVMLSSFEILLHRLSGQTEIVVGLPAAGQAASGNCQLVGHCVNLLPIRSSVDGAQTFDAYLQSRRTSVLDDFEHQQFTFGSLIKKLALPRDSSRIPLVSVAFNIDQGLEPEKLDFAGLSVKVSSNPRHYENFEIFINGTEQNGRLTLECQYNTNLFDTDTVRRRMAEFETLLRGIVAHPSQAIARLPLLPEAEQMLLATWNSTQVAFDQATLIHQYVEQQAQQSPDALAVQFEQHKLTYQALNGRANQLARRLRSLGVEPDVLVGICLERSPEMIVGALAIIKAGGAYVPLDPQYPPERLAFMLEDAQVKLLLTEQHLQESLFAKLPPSNLHILCLDSDWPHISVESDADLPNLASSNHLAYVIYTSGSTGKPKGVEICHLGLLNLIAWHQQTYGVTALDRATQIANPAFDASVWEIWPYLAAGASIHIPDAETRVTSLKLLSYLASEAISLCFLPTPLAELLLEQPIPDNLVLRALLTGGDQLRRGTAKPLPFQLVNHYGPTETTVVTTSALIPTGLESHGVPPIGRPIHNTQVHVLDVYQQPVPIGVPGELHIQGMGLARGYRNRPELTTEKFIPDPFSPDSDARLYKTGDLVRTSSSWGAPMTK